MIAQGLVETADKIDQFVITQIHINDEVERRLTVLEKAGEPAVIPDAPTSPTVTEVPQKPNTPTPTPPPVLPAAALVEAVKQNSEACDLPFTVLATGIEKIRQFKDDGRITADGVYSDQLIGILNQMGNNLASVQKALNAIKAAAGV